MSGISLGQVHHKLPNVAHHFSTLILYDGTYYELKGKFHWQYPSKPAYLGRWHYGSRVLKSAPEAVRSRTLAVLRRASIVVMQYQYMTTIHLRSGAMRHVSTVKISANDFVFLMDGGMLRKLHQVDDEPTAEEIARHVIYGLLPISLLLEKAAA